MLKRLGLLLGFTVLVALAAGPDTLWVRRLDFGGDEMAWGIDCRGDDIVATGFGTDSFQTDGCLTVKFNQSGDTVWSRIFATEQGDDGLDACIDADGNVYVAGGLMPSGRLKPGRLPTLAANPDQDYTALLLKYDSTGTLQWSRLLPGGAFTGVVTDDSGNCYVSGIWGEPGVASDLWFARFSPTGDSVWSRTMDFATTDIGYRATKGPGSALAFCGLLFGLGGGQGVVVRFRPDGETLWTRTLSAGAFGGLLGIGADRDGNFVSSGMMSEGMEDSLLTVKYDSSGALVWTRTLDIGSSEQGLGAACDSLGNSFVAGLLGEYPANSFAVKYSATGDVIWTTQYDGYEDEFYDVACDDAGDPVVAGRVSDGGESDFLVIKYASAVALHEPHAAANPPAPTAVASFGSDRRGILLNVRTPGVYQLDLYDLSGRNLGQFRPGFLAAGAHRLPVNRLPAGVCVVRVRSPGSADVWLRTAVVR
jgi:hypothetical protein